MRALRSGLLLVAGLMLLLAAVVAVRTVTYKGPSWERPIALADAIPVDGQAAARRLAEAIRFQTVSNQDEAADRRDQWDALHAWMAASYPKAHAAMARETVAGRTLVYTWRGSEPSLPPIVLMAHQDVVPVVPETLGQWTRPPFSGEIADGVVWGRGALDDKGSLVALMEAAETLAGRGFAPKRTVIFVFGHDEEVGGTGAKAAALLATRGVKPLFVLDEGGLALTKDPVSGRPMAMIGVAEKGYATLEVIARGQGGHSSMPPEQTAVHVLAKAVDRIASRPFPMKMDGPGADTLRTLLANGSGLQRTLAANEWLFGGLIAAQAGRDPGAASILRTSTAPTMLSGSPKENVLPDRAVALINFRIHPRDSLESVMAKARRDVGDLPVELRWKPGAAGASPTAPTDTRSWRMLAALAREATGAPPMPGLLSGATDGRAMARLTPSVYRFLPVLVTPEELESFHGVNERLSIQNLDRAAEFYARLIATAAG